MRIGLIAPPWVPVPPPSYGGTEEVVDQLARGLQAGGHEVILFTTGDATCPVPRKWVFAQAPHDMNFSMPECRHVQSAYDQLADCDVIHDHTTVGPIWAKAAGTPIPIVVTVHNPFTEISEPVYRRLAMSASIVAISRSHRASAPRVPVRAVIPHGIDPAQYRPGTGAGGFALFLGRFAPEKGAAAAIRIARQAAIPLVIAAKMRTPEERDYFDSQIRPELGPDTTFVGEVSKGERDSLLRDAVALINPITWSEPFGLVMIEALAHGTPVVAYPNGAAPEIIEEGATGFLPSNEMDAALALAAAPSLDRARCRVAVETYFSARRMVADYEHLYGQVAFRQSRRTG